MVIFKVIIIAFLFSRFSTFVGPILHKISVLPNLALYVTVENLFLRVKVLITLDRQSVKVW